ncbi:MFS transporter [Aeribacillus pallidus]|uniref:MFS transporter n=1 Tax=Aeribacillus pallidus TaxID=33936 RepID=UPI003D1F455E
MQCDETRLWTKSFTLLVLGNMFVFMSFQMLLPTLPPQAKEIGASPLEVGLVTSLFTFGAVLIRPLIGFLLGSSKRKWMVVVGATALLLLTFSYMYAAMIGLFLWLRLLHGFAWGWSTTANGTAAVELVPSKRIGEGMGYFALSMTVAMIAAPSLGIILYQNWGFETLICVASVIGLVAVLILTSVHYETPESVLQNKLQWKKFSFFRVMIERNGTYPAFITFLAAFGYGTIVTFIVIFGNERNIDQIFLFYLFNALTAIVVRPFTGKWFDRRGPWLLMMICSMLTFTGLWTLSYTNSVEWLILSGVLFGLGYGSMMPALQAWVISKTIPERRGVANGMFYSAIDLGIGVSSLFFGFISSYINLMTIFQLSSICFIIVYILTWNDWRKQKSKAPTSSSFQSYTL